MTNSVSVINESFFESNNKRNTHNLLTALSFNIFSIVFLQCKSEQLKKYNNGQFYYINFK